jgi:hypothetical protein
MSMSTRLRFSVIGLGQCGGNLANTFARSGYPSVAINTSLLDLKDLGNIPENRRMHVPYQESDGAGKDPRIGEKALQSHASPLLNQLQAFVQGADAILLVAGLGGGTGSNVPVLASMWKHFNLPIVALVTLPGDNESALSKINALRAVNRLISENLDTVVLIDNSKILEKFPDSSLARFYPQANEYVVQTFIHFNSLATELSSRCLMSFDNEDFRKVLLSKGVLILGESELAPGEISTLDDLLPKLKHIWESGGLMAAGFNFASAASGAICIYAPPELLTATSSRFLNSLGDEFKTLTGGATCYYGLYELPPGSPVKISTMLGRLTLPVRLQELLTEASQEGQQLSRKIKEEIPTLDISALDGMELFSLAPLPEEVSRGRETSVLDRSQASQEGSDYSDEGLSQDGQAYSPEDYVRIKRSKN